MLDSGIVKRFLLRALPLAVIDIIGTFAAFFISAYGTNVFDLVMAQPSLVWQMAIYCVINVVVFFFYGLYSSLWQYASVTEVVRIVAGTLVATILGDLLAVLIFGTRLPIRVYVCEWFILLAVCGASRFLIRIGSSRRAWDITRKKAHKLPRALVIGAGDSGSLAIKRMTERGVADIIPMHPVALVDDNPAKRGCLIHGVKVVGTCKDIERVCRNYEIEQIVLAAPSATAAQKKTILDYCVKTGLKVLSVPEAVKEMSPKQQEKVVLREVDAEDLLCREPVDLDLDQMGYITGKKILITGGGGSIGSEIVRQLIPAKPAQMVIFDIYENTAYELLHSIKPQIIEAGIDVRVEIGSITHMPAIGAVFEKYHPDVVFHAAAHKHVPLMENNPREAIENNVEGTLNLAKLADSCGCSHFVLISTDKAVRPTNVMGATKRLCEMVIQYYSRISNTKFAAVRFGNVLGSHGSVIPLFREQLKHGGPLTVTHKDITRYFMTIPEASKLVITAGAFAQGGEIFVLDMGEPVRIYDLAENLIRLSGFKVGEDVSIEITGLRPGEKLFEEIHTDTEPVRETANGAITVICGMAEEVDTLRSRLEYLWSHIDDTDENLKAILAQVVPTYTPQLEAAITQESAAEEDIAVAQGMSDSAEDVHANKRRYNRKHGYARSKEEMSADDLAVAIA